MTSTLALLNPTGFVSSSGYVAIFVLSVLQSCCVPTSSELTLGFGGVLASQGTLSLPGVILAGAVGEVIGGYIAWAIGRAGGRPLVERYGRYVLLSPHDLDRAEAWYGRHQKWGVLGSRLLPVIRNFVAVPAGVAQVPAVRFGVLTAIGSLIWDAAMALIGYGIGGRWKTVMKGFSDAGYLLGFLAVAAIAFVIWHRWRSYRSATAAAPSGPGSTRRASAHSAGSQARRRSDQAGPARPAAARPSRVSTARITDVRDGRAAVGSEPRVPAGARPMVGSARPAGSARAAGPVRSSAATRPAPAGSTAAPGNQLTARSSARPSPASAPGGATGSRRRRSLRARNAALRNLKVPARITGLFWAVKLLSTAMGEALSDALVHGINQYLAVLIGFVLFVVAMRRQLNARRYSPWTYWFAVCMVAVFGTMAADVMHIALHVPYIASTFFYAVALAVILWLWHRSEGTLSIHSVYTPRREIYYWLTVLATFALGTALGDLTAVSFNLGYLSSGMMFVIIFVVPAVAYFTGRLRTVTAFWACYILTRPLGASFADWLGFPKSVGGIGLGHPLTAVLFGLPIIALVSYINSSRVDISYPAADRLARLEPALAD